MPESERLVFQLKLAADWFLVVKLSLTVSLIVKLRKSFSASSATAVILTKSVSLTVMLLIVNSVGVSFTGVMLTVFTPTTEKSTQPNIRHRG